MTAALIGRDPRNIDHRQAAIKLISEIAGVAVLENTVADFRALHAVLPLNIKVWKSVRKGSLAIGAFFLLEDGMFYQDNVIRLCDVCHAALQFRPHLGHSKATLLCVFCAADRLLKEKEAKGKPRKR